MDQQEDLRRFIVQLEIVADHCDETGLRAGGATVREAIERLSRATPTPDVAELVVLAGQLVHGEWSSLNCGSCGSLTLIPHDQAVSDDAECDRRDETGAPCGGNLYSEEIEIAEEAQDVMKQLIAAVETLSRERAEAQAARDRFSQKVISGLLTSEPAKVLAEGFKAAIRELNDVVDPFVFGSLKDHEPDIHTGGRWAETPQRILAIRKALALIEGEKGEE